MPKDDDKVDEITAFMGNHHSMAELQTSMMTRSPGGPTDRSKLHMGLESSSILPSQSAYGVRDGQDSLLESLMLVASPDIRETDIREDYKTKNIRAQGATTNPKKAYDEYEDLLDTIEKEN